MIDTPEIVQSDARRTAVIRLTIPRSEMQQVMGPAIHEVMEAVAAQGIVPAGPVFSYHFRMDPQTFDFEVGVPVAEAFSPVGRVHASELRAANVARTVYRGGYEGLGGGWGELTNWIINNGHIAADDLWEFYTTGPESSPDPTEWATELNRPLVDA